MRKASPAMYKNDPIRQILKGSLRVHCIGFNCSLENFTLCSTFVRVWEQAVWNWWSKSQFGKNLTLALHFSFVHPHETSLHVLYRMLSVNFIKSVEKSTKQDALPTIKLCISRYIKKGNYYQLSVKMQHAMHY